MRFLLLTFGCKSNQYESQFLRESLVSRGLEEVETALLADVLIVNTCAVTGRAGSTCRSAIRRSLRENPQLQLMLTGCAVEVEEEWLAAFPQALREGNARKPFIPDRLLGKSGETPAASVKAGVTGLKNHTRVFLKIQDGCDQHCAYCLIPRARGEPSSRDPDDLVREAAVLAGNGYPEIVLTGINIGFYRFQAVGLASLLDRLAPCIGSTRLRLGSVEPAAVTEELLLAIKRHPAVCHHLHIPLQSGDPRILQAMRRRYSPEEFLEKVALSREILDHPAITSDVIVGFPGEDGDAFQNTREVCRQAAFSRLHVFHYSRRPGTPAADLPTTTPTDVISKWKRLLLLQAARQAEQYAASQTGREERVVAEVSGSRTDRYLLADIEPLPRPGAILRTRITGSRGARVTGVVIPDQKQ
ncbi:MAG: MiaB/RimO family radical SAM methylthiotransferase [Planctomycetota bacterium]|jgi:threonylcarbamoyladenosine tRNA methylthiotransferase MtaB|nr:MiaB/RimO family radical SAM methylthiotransferase [Planctomycetota bacterium]